MNPDQASLLDELSDADIAAIETELAVTAPVVPAVSGIKQQPKRKALPPELPRTLISHEPDNTQCPCGYQLKRIYEFAPSRAGKHARAFLQGWQGKLVCDDFSGYKASFVQGVTEIGCWAHARRKFYDLHASGKSTLAEQALVYIGQLYAIEAVAKPLSPTERRTLRQAEAAPVMDELYNWLIAQRQRVPKGSATNKAIQYSLKRWQALVRYLEDGSIPIDNNWVKNQVRPWALGRKNWLFAGSLRSGQRGAAIMSLIQLAKLNGHDPYAYLKDVLQRLPTQKNSAIGELLPHKWIAPDKV